MNIITSAHNAQLKQLAKLLASAKARREEQLAVLEGAHLLDACLNAGGQPEQVFVPESRADKAETRALLARLPQEKCTLVSKGALERISQLTEGAELMTLLPLPLPVQAPAEGDCIVLERVQDPGNAGTVLRSAAACGIRQVVLSDDCVDVWSPKVLRAGMGAHFLLDLHVRTDLMPWRSAYRGRVLATALGGCINYSLYELDLQAPCAWVFGNEGSGVSPALQQAADATVKIPMSGATESLNVAMAATVCLFEQQRQRLLPAKAV